MITKKPAAKGVFLKNHTLQVTTFSGNALWLTLFMLFVVFGAAEWTLRTKPFQELMAPPNMGSRHYQVGYKLALLEAAIRNEGSFDCIALGSSMVDTGFDPDAFKEGFRARAQRDIRCFNFGIDASSAASTAAITKIIVEDYRPRLLLVGTDARDYVLPVNDPDVAVILDSPWIKYRLGDFSLDGWLVQNSYLFRYRQHLRYLTRFEFENVLWSEAWSRDKILPSGFTPLNITKAGINEPPDPGDTSYEVAYYTRIFSSYRMIDENLEALKVIFSYNNPQTQVILVEMPVSDGMYHFFGNGEIDHATFIARVSALADQSGVLFLQTEPIDLIPDDGWADYSHLNRKGAGLFSSWLGRQVAAEWAP